METKSETTTGRVSVHFDTIVKRITWWLKAKKYATKWYARKLHKEWIELRGFIWWMNKKYGKPRYGSARSLNWRRNEDGVLISLFLDTNIMKIYYSGGRQTVNFFVDKSEQRAKAKYHLNGAK